MIGTSVMKELILNAKFEDDFLAKYSVEYTRLTWFIIHQKRNSNTVKLPWNFVKELRPRCLTRSWIQSWILTIIWRSCHPFTVVAIGKYILFFDYFPLGIFTLLYGPNLISKYMGKKQREQNKPGDIKVPVLITKFIFWSKLLENFFNIQISSICYTGRHFPFCTVFTLVNHWGYR